jgi:hypothetical protein
MHNKFKWLQLFADGTGEGGAADSGVTSPAAAGQDTGVNASAVAGQTVEPTQADRLRELGVPESKLKRAKYSQKAAPQKQQETASQAAAAETQEVTEEAKDTAKRLSWDEIMADPEYNGEMRKVVKAAKEKLKTSAEGLEKLAPAIQLIAKKYGVDASDYDAVSKAVVDDDAYYEERAMELGVTTDVAKQLDKSEKMMRAAEEQQQKFINEQKLMEHIGKLNRQAIELQQKYPDFNLGKELNNPTFARLTAPDLNLPLEDAYELVHREEIKENIRQAALKASIQQVSNAVQSNKNRPNDGVSKSSNASVQTFNYQNATKAQREALKARIRSGEKIFPGQL